MHSRKLYCTAGSFIAQREALLHNKFFLLHGKKVSPAAETGEKFLLRQKLEKSSFCSRNWKKVHSAAETEDKHYVLPAVSVLLADEAQFAHKPDQIELQLDRSQLPYSKYSGSIPQEATQPTLTIKRPTTMVPRPNLGGDSIFLHRGPLQAKAYPYETPRLWVLAPTLLSVILPKSLWLVKMMVLFALSITLR